MKPLQIPFDFDYPDLTAPDDFIVSDSNRIAHDAVMRWPQWFSPFMVVHGPDMSGKSLLARCWQEKCQARIVPAADLCDDAVMADLCNGQDNVMVEDVDHSGVIDSPVVQEALFNLYNCLQQNKRFMLLTAQKPIRMWPVFLKDLSSRLGAAGAAEIETPDDGLLEQLFTKLMADRNLEVDEDVSRYAVERMERSFAAVHWLVRQVDAKALSEKRTITKRLLGDIFKAIET